jgi:hypothetical protein
MVEVNKEIHFTDGYTHLLIFVCTGWIVKRSFNASTFCVSLCIQCAVAEFRL